MMDIDIRTRLFISALFSALALFYQRIEYLLVIMAINILTLIFFKIRIKVLFSIKKLLYISVMMIVIQSIFVRTGRPLIKLGSICLVTDDGITYGIAIFLRFIILMLSGLFLLNSNISELTRGLVKLGMPYEIAFMIQMSARFVPVFLEELGDVLNSIQLRGVDLKKVYKRKVINVYLSIFLPIIYSIWQKAEKLAILMELRGFRTSSNRTYYREVCFNEIDYAIMILYLSWAAAFVYITI